MTAKDLKNALLQEAIQGKLVPQIASEGNAKDLLEEIRKERGESLPLASARKRASATPSAGSNAARNARFAPITEEDIPFDIPENWCWCRLIDVLKDKPSNGISPKEVKYETKIRSLSLSATTSGVFDSNAFKYVELDNNTASKYWLKKNDLLIQRSNSRELVGTSCIYYGDDNLFIYPDLMMRMQVQQNIKLAYIDYVLKSPHVRNYFSKNASGTSDSMPKINQTIVCNTLIPLPPLPEQKRIVAAIEKFMPLIEEYGKKETELKAFNEQIGTLTKKAILQEAVQGKLVPQIAAEGNAKDLLEEIKKEKAKLIKEGKIKKEKPLPEITEDEIPFDIPENWCWCKVGDLFSTMSGLGYKKDVLSEKTSKMVRVLRGGNILDTSYVFKDDDIMISGKYVKSELFLKKNYLITPAVTSLEHIGKIGYVEKDYDDTVVGGFVLMLLPHYSDEILSKYCLYLFATRWFRDMCKEITHKSGQAFYNLSRDKLLNLVIPIAPLTEQKRIVVAIEKLLPLCEKLGE